MESRDQGNPGSGRGWGGAEEWRVSAMSYSGPLSDKNGVLWEGVGPGGEAAHDSRGVRGGPD